MQPYVVGFAFSTDQDYVALIKKTKPTWQAGLLNGIGGKVESGECHLDAMRREWREETGTDQAEWQHFAHWFTPGYSLDFFRAFRPDLWDLQSPTPEEVFVVRLDEQRLWQRCVPNLRMLIPIALSTEYQPPLVLQSWHNE